MKLLDKCFSIGNKNKNVFKQSLNKTAYFQKNNKLLNFSITKFSIFSKEIITNPRKINSFFNRAYFSNDNYAFNKTIRKFKSEEIKQNYEDKESEIIKENKFSKKKRKSNIDKTIKKKDFSNQGNAIINIFSKSPILAVQSLTEGKDQEKIIESFNQEKKLYEEIIALLHEGKLNEAALIIIKIIELLMNQELNNFENDNHNNKSAIKLISIENNPKINNKTILKKIQIYKIALGDIYNILAKKEESEFHLKNVIYLLEANTEKLTDQDRFLLIRLKERLCTSYLDRDDDDFIEEKLSEECEKLIESNIIFIEKKVALREIEMQQSIYLNLQKMLLENLHFLAMLLKKENKFKESNVCLLKYLRIKERFPILSQNLINLEYSVHLNLALNFNSLKEMDNSVNYLKLAMNYLNDESQENFVEAKILIVDKLCDIYEEQAYIQKLMESLEEKKRLIIELINLKTESVKEYLVQEKLNNLSTQETHVKEQIENCTNENLTILNIENKNFNKNQNQDQNKISELIDFSFKNTPLFIDFEDFALKKDYLSIARVYEELIELILENELQPENFEHYLSEAQKYYNMLQKEEVFAANLNFILFMKNYDDAKFETALEYGLKILKAIEAFETKCTYVIDPNYFGEFKEEVINFLQIDEAFYELETAAQKNYLLNKFTNFDFYGFETKFKIYFYLSKIHKALNNQEQKAKYQNFALQVYEEELKKIKNVESEKEISVFYLIDLMSIYENRRISYKLFESFDLIVNKIKVGEIDFLKKDDEELYTKTVYDVFFMKINYLIFEEKFQEAKETLKVLDKCPLGDKVVKFTEEQRDNLNKTLNLLDLKLKYIK
jgi:hypothetical protein